MVPGPLHELGNLRGHQGEEAGEEGLHLVHSGLEAVHQDAPVLRQGNQLPGGGVDQQGQPAPQKPEEQEQYQGGQQLPVPAQKPLQALNQGVEQDGGHQGKEEGGKQGEGPPPKPGQKPHPQSRQRQPQAQTQPELSPLPPCELFVGHVHRPFFNSIPQNR